MTVPQVACRGIRHPTVDVALLTGRSRFVPDLDEGLSSMEEGGEG